MKKIINGILLIDKEEGETSFDVVRKLKHRFKGLKVGHAGTLDPFATGLMIILLGQGTKLSNLIMSEDKIYQATMCMGIETDSQDLTGKILATSEVPDLSLEEVRTKARDFIGQTQQTPPLYSATKYNGTRAYKLARKGIKVELPKKNIFIHYLKILNINTNHVSMEIKCSKGTYIRTLAVDLGKSLGTVAHLHSLRRLASGKFHVNHSIKSTEIPKLELLQLTSRIIPLREALPNLKEIELNDQLSEQIKHGYQPSWDELNRREGFEALKIEDLKLVKDQQLVAISRIEPTRRKNHEKLKIYKVFS